VRAAPGATRSSNLPGDLVVRTPLVAANWKLQKLPAEAASMAEELTPLIAEVSGVEMVICPTYTSLHATAAALAGSPVAVGGQNCYKEEKGAFTGEISPQMLLDAGCQWVIIGHSERRKIFGEQDELLNEKAKYALACGLKVMFCIGETLEEREGGAMDNVLRTQVTEGLNGLDANTLANLAIAYEPVWAIGTGVVATPDQAEEAHAFVRKLIEETFGVDVAEAMRIQYGGSVKPDNAAELIAKPNVDGFLVGGASLEAGSFSEIIKAAA